MRLILFAGAWLTTIAVAFLVGRSAVTKIVTEAAPAPPPAFAESANAPPRDPARSERAGGQDTTSHATPANPAHRTWPTGATGDGTSGQTAPTFDFRQTENIRDLSAGYRKYVVEQLARGPAGYQCIIQSIDRLVTKDREVLRHMDERMASREAYPWVRMLVQQEPLVLDLIEFVYRSMAENASLFRDLQDDTLEIFVDGTPQVLTGAMDEPRLRRMIGYARATLATSAEEQPSSIQGIRRDLERLLSRSWAEPVPPEEALGMIRSGGLAPEQALAMLRNVDPRGLPSPDLNILLALALSTGSTRAIRDMQRFPGELLDPVTLDPPVVRGMEGGNFQGYYVKAYLAATGRDSWPDSRRFLDQAFSSGGRAGEAAAITLQYLRADPKPPDKAYVQDVLQRHKLSQSAVGRLRAAYGLQ